MMQQQVGESNARLKLLSVLKVSDNKTVVNEVKKEEGSPSKSVALAQLKQVLFKNTNSVERNSAEKLKKERPEEVPLTNTNIIESIPFPKLSLGNEKSEQAVPELKNEVAIEQKKENNIVALDSAPVAEKKSTPQATALADIPTANPPSRRRLFFIRSAASCRGSIDLLFRPNKHSNEELTLADDFKLRPGSPLICSWRLPIEIFAPMPGLIPSTSAPPGLGLAPIATTPPPQKQLMIGLYRFGCHSNKDGSIISKPIEEFTDNNQYRSGKIKFFCPKSAGLYIFRIYDANAPESQYETLAISVRITIILLEFDIQNNLKFVLTAFREQNPLKGLGLMNVMLPHMRNKGNNDNNNVVVEDMNQCVQEILTVVEDSIDIIEEGQFKKKTAQALAKVADVGIENAEEEKKAPSPTPELDGVFDEPGKEHASSKEKAQIEDDGESEFWKRYRIAMKVHAESQDTLLTLSRCKTPWYWVSEKLKRRVKQRLSLYCPILRRYFQSSVELHQTRLKVLDFCPSGTGIVGEGERALSVSADPQLAKNMSNALSKVTNPLMTDREFEVQRAVLCERVEQGLTNHGFCQKSQDQRNNVKDGPASFNLAVYGSSRNGFGNRASDIDICLAIPSNLYNNSITKLQVMMELEEKLNEIGMTEVKSLLTARVPIVEFVDPETGCSCDISLQNELAVANTEMLRIYSEIDPRVRQLAYLVKYWAKTRDINTPQQGTLGSYAYVLTVLHFLQNRPQPVIPILQSLKSDEVTGEVIYSNFALEQWVINPIDGTRCNIYFFKPNTAQFKQLKEEAKKNTESLSELFLEYLKYFCYQFDSRNAVVTIRDRRPLVKQEKYEYYCWPHTDLLSVEDPFEIHYDVAHILRPNKMVIIRKEYLRAYTIISRTIISHSQLKRTEPMIEDSIPYSLPAEKAVELLFQQA